MPLLLAQTGSNTIVGRDELYVVVVDQLFDCCGIGRTPVVLFKGDLAVETPAAMTPSLPTLLKSFPEILMVAPLLIVIVAGEGVEMKRVVRAGVQRERLDGEGAGGGIDDTAGVDVDDGDVRVAAAAGQR